MKLLFMTNLYPKEKEEIIRNKMKFNMYDAANVLQWNIVNGINCVDSVNMTLYNHIPVDSYPNYYSDWYVRGFKFSHNGSDISENIPFLNVKYLKRLFINFPYVKYCKKWAKNNADGILLAYSLNTTFLKAIKKIKRFNKQIKSYVIVADLPQFTSPKMNVVQRIYCNRNIAKIKKLLKYVDGFILLTDQMAKKLEINKPYIVMEGMINNTYELYNNDKNDCIKTVFYSGSLNKQYGIINLLDAFKLILDENYRLVLCGLGNAEDVIKEFCLQDSRVLYKGKLSHEEVLKLQQSATVLVNPRQNNEEFTKYSFPSKTMEYLASGVPVIAYKLDGIPDEYGEYLNYVNDDSPESLAKLIMDICELPKSDREKKGEKGKKFVLNEKNNIKQSKKILNFIRGDRDV